jgi:tRNA pseudouridine38-40 synthase
VTPRSLKRFALTVHYDGAPFHGWQIQKEERTVQGELESVLGRISGERRVVVGSGRTDRGVHATGQVASVDLPEKWTAGTLRTAVNALLPPEIWVAEARRVPDDFHPRYHATLRSYEYRIGTVDAARSPFHRPFCWPLGRDRPRAELLARAARLVPGERSFARFARAGQPERGERCRVTEATWTPWDRLGFRFRICADRFLHHMVRYLVGTMVAVACGRRPLGEMEELLEHPESPLRTSPPAPPEGLFLSRVEYPRERLGNDPDLDPPTSNGTHGA